MVTLKVSVARVSLSDFRCHQRLRLDCGDVPVVLTGANGVGKTSVLEALSLLAPGRGLRRGRLDDIARRDAQRDGQHDGASAGGTGWAVAARLRLGDRSSDIDTDFRPDGAAGAGGGRERRRILVDGEPLRAQSGLAGLLSVLWLTPDMDRLFLDGASARRRFLDRLVYGADPAHAGRVAAYEKAMAERSRLLRAGTHDPSWLGALEDAMSRRGVAIAAARQDLADRLTAAAAVAEPFPAPTVESAGPVESWLADGPALAAEERLRDALAEARAADAESGGAAIGPHRSEIVVRHRATGRLAAACSTGEQKTLLIALVLAAARLQRSANGTLPLLLLDEVVAHLDRWHRQALFAAVGELGVQAWYAGTDAAVFQPLAGRAQVVILGQGTVMSGDAGAAGFDERGAA
jgi:DNA replication and repair protein RecF